ncbi:MAG TPA: hypothetical protein VIF11_17635 [Methylomirabilota bacterium]
MNKAGSLALLLWSAALVAPACAQEPTQPNLLLRMSRPSQALPIDSSSMRDDLAARPGPTPPDPSRQPFRLYVGVGDARCFPGEDGLGLDRYPVGTRRRVR